MSVQRRSQAVAAITVTAAVITVAMTVLAFAASYTALSTWARTHEHPGWVHIAWPLFLDGFITVGSLMVLVAALQGRRAWYALALAVAGSVASVAFNIAHVGTWQGRVTAAVPPLAAILAFELATRELYRRLRPAPAETVVETVETLSQPETAPETVSETVAETPSQPETDDPVVVALRLNPDLTWNDVAGILGCSRSTAYRRLEIARGTLKAG